VSLNPGSLFFRPIHRANVEFGIGVKAGNSLARQPQPVGAMAAVGDNGDGAGEVTLDLPIRRSLPKVGRNEPCPCGSGKKYKKCHLDSDEGR